MFSSWQKITIKNWKIYIKLCEWSKDIIPPSKILKMGLKIRNRPSWKIIFSSWGPLLVLSSNLEVNPSLSSYINMKTYKTNVKSAILITQGSERATEWQGSNFSLQNITGLRQSRTNYRVAGNYSELN